MDEHVSSQSLTTPYPAAHTGFTRQGLELRIGSNSFRHTNGVITIQGKEQLVFENKPQHGLFLLTFDLYSREGTKIAHLRRNVLKVNQDDRFLIHTNHTQQERSTDPLWILLTDRETREIVLEAHMPTESRIQISSGRFYSHKGNLVEITPHYCRIGSGMTLFGDIRETQGGSALLG